MESGIIRGYWACPYCESHDIDGLVDECPNCGRHKPTDTKYYMKLGSNGKARAEDRLTGKELEKAGISEEECDGEHKEWVCSYCDSLNNWADAFCKSCNSPREESTKEYGATDASPEDTESMVDDLTEHLRNMPEKPLKPSLWTKVRNVFTNRKKEILGSMAALAAIGLGAFLFWPIQEVQTATDFSWDRSIVIEEEKTVKESGWSVPFGGRVYDERSEFHHYEQVLDHYETVTEQKSRQVLDHYETKTVQKSRTVVVDYEVSYTDNGNGTFSEHRTPVYGTEYYTDTEEEPVYRTEYYEESHQEPVYRDEPVYQTKYYYELDKWFSEYTSDSAGRDKNPYWNTDYTLQERERDLLRYENYYVYYTDEDGDQERVSTAYDEWMQIDYGDQIIVTTSRIGLTYKVEASGKE